MDAGHALVRRLLLATYPGNWVPADVYIPQEAASPVPGEEMLYIQIAYLLAWSALPAYRPSRRPRSTKYLMVS